MTAEKAAEGAEEKIGGPGGEEKEGGGVYGDQEVDDALGQGGGHGKGRFWGGAAGGIIYVARGGPDILGEMVILLGKHWWATSMGAHYQCSPETYQDFLVHYSMWRGDKPSSGRVPSQ